MKAPEPMLHVLATDPRAGHRLNAWSYQASAIISWNNYQYVAYYTSQRPDEPSTRLVTLSRRCLSRGENHAWESFCFKDYEQTTDDGHNTISLGICRVDGTIHVSFDHHADRLKYRRSIAGVATSPHTHGWTTELFSSVQNTLRLRQDGSGPDNLFQEVTYPRFVTAGKYLLLEYRIGKAGAGSDVLWKYVPSSSTFEFLGIYLIGVGCNPYPNGFSYDERVGLLHVSWTNRHFVEYEGHDDPASTVHQAQAGPNGPENNQDLCCAVSSDHGSTWRPSIKADHATVRHLMASQPESGLVSTSNDLVAVAIPKNSGIMNQESQCLDVHGGLHVLNRDSTSGTEEWKHYHLAADSAQWTTKSIPFYNPTTTGPRASVAFHPGTDSLFFVLPSNLDDERLHIVRGLLDANGTVSEYEHFWSGEWFDGEPLIDEYGLEEYNILSIFTTRPPQVSASEQAQVVVLDFVLS